MTVPRTILYPLLSAMISLIAACTSNQKSTPIKPIPTPVPTTQTPAVTPSGSTQTQEEFAFPVKRAIQNPNQTINDFYQLESVLSSVKAHNDQAALQFLSQQNQSAMGESVRNEWLKSLGARQQVSLFQQQYQQLAPAGRHQEVRCYAHLFGLENDGQFIQGLVRDTARLPNGCNALLQARASQLNPSDAWRRVRGLISNNQITDARQLASALGSPLEGGSGFGAQENLLRDIISPNGQKSLSSATRLSQLSNSLNREQLGFAWGVLGLAQAKNQEFATALSYFQQSEPSQLTNEQFEWYARSALRFSRWNDLAQIIESMPADLKKESTWLYWLARSYAAQGKTAQAQNLYQQAARTGRNFYAVLSLEELGQRVDVRNNVADATREQLQVFNQDGAFQNALNLFRTSQQGGNWKMRRQAQTEFRYATRGLNEKTQLAAAQWALDNQFYEMAINTADNTNHLLNFRLRYITPYSDLVKQYSAMAGIDPAWVYGLIRQESRFIMGAQSSVGAQGLMQVMPSTAQMIARKIGLSNSDLYTLDGNIRMGTWYLADAKNNLQNNEVMATAGYNAGPGRARKWQANQALEGAIYAETIPFNETRDYVKKVMTNATYYAALLNQTQHLSLKKRMGVVPARY